MYANCVLFKLNRNSNIQHYAVLNIWSQSRHISLLQKCRDCLNKLLRKPSENETICNVSETCCSARSAVLEALSSSHESTSTAPTARTQYGANVVVVGAGMAGLSAANHLHDNGVENITVLEALERPGGRIQSAWFGDSVIELGSPIEKSPIVNPIVQSVFEDGLTQPALNQADPSRGLLLRSDGSIIPYPITFQVYQIFKNVLDEANRIEESGESRESKIKFIGSRIEQEIGAILPDFVSDAQRVFHGLASMTTINSMRDSSLIKSNKLGAFVQLPGSNLSVPLGHFGEIHKLYRSLPKDTVRFESSVVKIRWGGVTNALPRAVVVCDNGDSYEADYVIITLPVGVLKTLSDSLFCPGLPAKKTEAILNIGTNQIHRDKIFVQLKLPFWLWHRDFKKITFDSSTMKCKEGWLKGLRCIEPVRGSSHVVCLTIEGPQAKCLENLSDKEIISDVLSLLTELTRRTVPDSVGLTRTCWSGDPHFLGAFSPMGSCVNSNDFYGLASPLPEEHPGEYSCEPVLLFAGEATCPVHYGTVQGAKASGIREADRLIQLIRMNEANEQQQEMSYCY